MKTTKNKLKTSWNKGKKWSKETKKKISESKKGKPSWNKGKKWSKETKKKISESKKGKPSWNKGIKWSDEVKKKISQTKLGLNDKQYARFKKQSHKNSPNKRTAG